MSIVVRIIAGTASIAICAFLILAGLAAAVLWTGPGQDLLRRETARLASHALGPDYIVALGQQTIGIGSTGRIGLGFTDVAVRDRRTNEVVGSAGLVRAGVSLTRLLTGSLALETLAVESVRLAPGLLDLENGDRPFAPDDLFLGADRIFVALDQAGLRVLDVSDIEVLDADGDTRLDRLTVSRVGGGATAIDLGGQLDSRAVAMTGRAALSTDGSRLASLSLETAPIDLSFGDPPADPRDRSVAFEGEGRLAAEIETTESGRVLRARFEAGGGRILGHMPVDVRTALLELRLEEGRSTATISQGRIETASVVAKFTGGLDLVADAAGRHDFDLTTSQLRSTAGDADAAPRSADFALGGWIDVADGAAEIERFLLDTGDGRVSGAAMVGGLEAGDRIRADVALDNLDAAVVKAFWPIFLAPEARDWVSDRAADSGRVQSGAFTLDIAADRLPQVMQPDIPPAAEEMHLTLAIDNAAFATFGGLPKLSAVTGDLDFRAGKTLIAVKTAEVAGFADVALLPSSIQFEREDEGVIASLSLNIGGEATSLLAIADRDPVNALAKIGWTSDEVSGKATAGVNARILLGSPGEKSVLQNWTVMADLDGVDLKRKLEGRQIGAVTGLASLSPGTVFGDVSATIDGFPVKIAFSEPLEPDPVGERSLTISASLETQQLQVLAPALGNIVDGALSATLVRSGETYRAAIDLSAARLRIPATGWSKGPGVPASLSFDLSADGDAITLRNARLEGEGFHAEGRVAADGNGLKSVTIDKAAFSRGDDFSASVQRQGAGYSVEIKGKSLDARAGLARLRANGEASAAAGSSPLDLSIAVDRIIGFGGEEFRNATVAYRQPASGAPVADIAAIAVDGSPLRLVLEKRGEGRNVELGTDNAGALLRFTGLYSKMYGGKARLAMAGNQPNQYGGQLVLHDFTLVDESRLARLVGTTRDREASLAGAVGQELQTSDAYFDAASAQLSWNGERLVAGDGIVRGPIFGSSFEGVIVDGENRIAIDGSFMPAYGVNRLFGAIPFFGGILGNGQEGGLIGITYRLAGPLADPTLSVNPISAIAPGIFRRIFEY
ncbi:hypothetical protein VQ042_08310 [Aurantimonas sp. A2-1-M11]|uniref:hypothetical protein n=1 Tax=Aurantimonas sp. A2-1-M11 TaxID=3113712 RepID=UPI002F935BB3